MKYLLLIALLLPTLAFADDPALQYEHDWSHIGGGFIVQTVAYGFFRKGLKMEKKDAFLFSLTSSFILTTMYSLSGPQQTNSQLGHTMLMNGIGAGLSVGTCLVFDF